MSMLGLVCYFKYIVNLDLFRMSYLENKCFICNNLNVFLRSYTGLYYKKPCSFSCNHSGVGDELNNKNCSLYVVEFVICSQWYEAIVLVCGVRPPYLPTPLSLSFFL